MVYLILTWKDALEQMIERAEQYDELCCPLCLQQHDAQDYDVAVRHLKMCYMTRQVKHRLFQERHLQHNRRDKIDVVCDVAEQVEQEINRYLNDSSYVYHLF